MHLLAILHTNQTGSSFRDESMHSAVTQKQSIDSMTLSRCQSFKMQPSNQFKLKSNHHSNNSGTLMECQQQSIVDLSIDHTDEVTIKNCAIPLRKNRSIKSEYGIYNNSEINSNVENRIESAEMLSIAPSSSLPPTPPPPLIKEINTNQIRLPMESTNTQSTHVRRTIKPICYSSKLRRSTAQPFIRSWFSWFRPKNKNTAFYSPPFEHPTTRSVKIQIHTNENLKGVRSKCLAIEAGTIDTSTTVVNFVDNNNISSNDDEDISNSSLQNVDSIDELAAYMDEIRAREKR